ncbi:phosphate ABC transporter substrate-binding protein PstS [Microbulbifer sp. SAOS-129_SWC]|uniref:phosphate ABC transporter substrate-binding protein PstS n=1 Tax=Microbulbifer sp. SAOS-129_SWC TaxID=3145235 RepID=UPI0032178923
MDKKAGFTRSKKWPFALLFALTLVLAALAVHFYAGFDSSREEQSYTGPVRVLGSGASFPAPLYQRWFRDIYREESDIQVDYQSIGSGAGIANFLAGRTDFAGSDYPLSESEAAKVEGGVIQLPMAAGAIVFVYNLPGIQRLNLSRGVLADIASGKIQNWNDPRIRESNPKAALPDLKLTLVARAEASGTSFHMSSHIAAYSKTFRTQVGASKSPNWPQALKNRGALILARGNFGVASMVASVPGALGYVQFSYAKLPNLQMAALENRAGNMIYPSMASFRAAVASVQDHLALEEIADPEGGDVYPLISLSWLIMRRKYNDPDVLAVMKAIVRYGLTRGQESEAAMGYIPFPRSSRKKIIEYFDKHGGSGS